MNKKRIIIILGFSLVVLVLVVYILSMVLNDRLTPGSADISPTFVEPPLPNGVIPTNAPRTDISLEGSQSSTLVVPGAPTVESSSPRDRAENVSTDTTSVRIQLSEPVDQASLEIFFAPDIDFGYVVNNNTIIITFITPLQESTIYSYTLKDNNLGVFYTGSFTTEGPPIAYYPDTRPDGFFEEEAAYLRENRPDVYLSNNVPYESETFSIQSRMIEGATTRFVFDVRPKAATTQQVRNDLNNWLKQLQLTDEQISQLEITIQ
jgi:hypothetical protein